MKDDHNETLNAQASPDEKPDIAAIHAAIMRENGEPADGQEPVPMLWLACVIAMAMWAGSYFGAYNMGFMSNVLEGDPIAGTVSAPQAAPEPVSPMVAGKRIFNQCQACHQATGLGVPGQFPPLDKSEWVLGDTQTLARILLHGLEGDVTVRGTTYNNLMPAWERLSDAQIAHVLTYIRGSWSNNAAAVAPEDIKMVREATASRHSAWSAQELVAAAKGASP